MIYALLSAQGFTPYKNEKLLDPPAKYTVDLRLTQVHHQNVMKNHISGFFCTVCDYTIWFLFCSGTSSRWRFDLLVSSIIRGLRARVFDSQTSLSCVKTSISTLQLAATSMEETLVVDMRELTPLELIRTSQLADHEVPINASDGSGSPPVH